MKLSVDHLNQDGSIQYHMCGPEVLVGSTHSFSNEGWGTGASGWFG